MFVKTLSIRQSLQRAVKVGWGQATLQVQSVKCTQDVHGNGHLEGDRGGGPPPHLQYLDVLGRCVDASTEIDVEMVDTIACYHHKIRVGMLPHGAKPIASMA